MTLADAVARSVSGFLPPGLGDFSSTGVGTIDFALDVLVVAGVIFGGLYGFYRVHLKPWLKKIADDSRTSAENTANSHASSPHPNLRDNIDANQAESRAAFQALMQASDHLREAIAQQAKDIGGIRAELRADREAQRETAAALAQHIRDSTHQTP